MRYQKIKILYILFVLIFALSGAVSVSAETEVLSDTITNEKAKVVEIITESKKKIAGTEVLGIVQELKLQIIRGPEQGKFIELENDYNQFDVGDMLYVTKTVRTEDGKEFYIISDSYRLPTLIFFVLLFVVLVVLVGGKQGVRGLLSLIGSLVLIVFVLLPGITSGFSPILVSILVSSIIIIFGSYVTHGFNKTTSSAVFGMIVTVVMTGVLAYLAVHFAKLTGFESEEAVYLNFNAKGHIDIVGILLGGIMIGLLGVLYDVAIGQAIAVEELHSIAPHVDRYTVYKRAIRMGREHIGALVNTLAIAYVGASLPLLLLFSTASIPLLQLINKEIFATEIMRTLVGSIGLVLAVPITTVISVFLLIKKTNFGGDSVTIREEEEKLQHHNHRH